MAETTISWASTVWNPVTGCSRVGGPESGCWNCYAARFARRFDHPGDVFEGPTTVRNGRVDWSGQVRLRPERLEQPLRWRKPRRIFVDSMSDLYHAKVPFEFIAAVHGVAAACPQHQFLILTKRPERMLEFYRWIAGPKHARRGGEKLEGPADACQCYALDYAYVSLDGHYVFGKPWPLPNVMVGVSAENQEALEERWTYLAQVPAAVRWVSLEPLLGPVDVTAALKPTLHTNDGRKLQHPNTEIPHLGGEWRRGADWIVVGAESGPGARPCDINWIRSVVRQCNEAGTPVHVKQLGARPYETRPTPTGEGFDPSNVLAGNLDRDVHQRWWQRDGWTLVKTETDSRLYRYHRLANSKGANPEEWPPDLRVRQWPGESNG